MAMLSDRDLHKLVKEQQIVNPFILEHCQGATINLTLDPFVKKYVSSEPIVLGKEVTEDLYKSFDITKQDFIVQPKESVLIQTHEYVQIPENTTARIYERYSVKSLGLMISPSHYMNPGYRGKISLLLINHSSVPVQLVAGIKICQLALFTLSSEPLTPYEKQDAKYMDSMSVSISKLHLDSEIQDYLKERGVKQVSNEMAKDLGEHLMSHVRKAAKELADIGRDYILKGKLPNE
ncbi:dCTP deaminase [Fictibacillus sp. JL2B1089]|jgi:dCTP deaminase|uniref:dCTP deaminase n=1 Tax=Fictibacillus sp. JL2B1089 TaxID=3399565 RepID=UPI003A8BDCBC